MNECDGNACCEDGPNALCCLNDGVCSNENFVYNGTNLDECQCICNESYKGNECRQNKCEGIFCSNGSCVAGNCICDNGYVNIEGNCEETCALNPCQELIQI